MLYKLSFLIFVVHFISQDADVEAEEPTSEEVERKKVFLLGPAQEEFSGLMKEAFSANAGPKDKKGKLVFTCGCQYYKGGPCSQQFPLSELHDVRQSHFELSHEELDLVILSQIQSGMHHSKVSRMEMEI